MAREVVTRVTDDIDGSDNASTVAFAFNGKNYEIDLSFKNAEKLERALAPFVAKARQVRGGSSARQGASRRSVRSYDLPALREWANKNKVTVPARGRVPQAIVDKFLAASGT